MNYTHCRVSSVLTVPGGDYLSETRSLCPQSEAATPLQGKFSEDNRPQKPDSPSSSALILAMLREAGSSQKQIRGRGCLPDTPYFTAIPG